MKAKFTAIFMLSVLLVACKTSSDTEVEITPFQVKDVRIFTQKPVINLNDTVFFSVYFNANYNISLSDIESVLNSKYPVGVKLQHSEISASDYKGYFLPVKSKGEHNLSFKFTKNGQSFSFSKKIKILDSYSIGNVWEELKNYDETKELTPFAMFNDNYYQQSTSSVGTDFINVSAYYKPSQYPYMNFTKFIEGFYGVYSLIYDSNKALSKIRVQNDISLINTSYNDILADLSKVYGNPVRSGVGQYTGFKYSEYETDNFKIRVEEISVKLINAEITRK